MARTKARGPPRIQRRRVARSSPLAVADIYPALSESDSDIDLINLKATNLLGSFQSYGKRNGLFSSGIDSGSSSAATEKDSINSKGTVSSAVGLPSPADSRLSKQPSPSLSHSSQTESSIQPCGIDVLTASQAMHSCAQQPVTKKRRLTIKPVRQKQSTPTPTPSQLPKQNVTQAEPRYSKRNTIRMNYYATPPGFGRGGDVTDKGGSDSGPLLSSSVASSKRISSPKRQSFTQYHRACHNSETLTLVKEPIGSTAKGKRASYHSREEMVDYDAFWAKHKPSKIGPEGTVIHTDFDFPEMNAMYYFLTRGGEEEADIPIQNLIIQRSRLHDQDELSLIVSRIKLLYVFNKLLRIYVPNLTAFYRGLQDEESFAELRANNSHLVVICAFLEDQLSVTSPSTNMNLRYVKRLLDKAGNDKVKRLACDIEQATLLQKRSTKELHAFLVDAKSGMLSTAPISLRAHPTQFDQEILRYDRSTVSAHLRSRELGYPLYRAQSSIRRTLVESTNRKWNHCKAWRGASGDVVTLAWSPNGICFAAGAVTYCHPQNVTNNQGNNLLIGDLSLNSLKDLPDHRVPRRLIVPNLTDEDIAIAGPHVSTSITAVAWSKSGDRMYSSSYDNTVKIWDATSYCGTRCIGTLRHQGKVHVMSLSDLDNRLLATGTESDSNFRLWQVEESGLAISTPLKITQRDIKDFVPTSLVWGSTHSSKNLLIGGLSASDRNNSGDPPIGGHLQLWRAAEADIAELSVVPNSRNVFETAWHPSAPRFAAGTAACGRSQGLGADIRSMVMIYEPLRSRRDIVSYDCPGLDINDVTFCPFNENYISASCTDGVTYVWDFRNPDKILHKLKHEEPLGVLNSQLTREQADTGIRFVTWGQNISQFYTGSSDGRVKSWDIMASTEDVFLQDIASVGSEITSGALSPDKSSMIIGSSGGGLGIFTTSEYTPGPKELSFEYAREAEVESDPEDYAQPAKELIETGQIIRHPIYGPLKGPNYRGPYAAWARPSDTPADEIPQTMLSLRVQAKQLVGPAVEKRPGLTDKARKKLQTRIWAAKKRNRLPPTSSQRPSQCSQGADGGSVTSIADQDLSTVVSI